MADRPAAIDVAHPPELMLKIVNPTLGLALKTPLGRFAGDFMLVEFTGRKSGRRYSTPVSAHRLDGDLYAVLEAQWKFNFSGGAEAVVYVDGTKSTRHGELIGEPAAVAALVERIATGYGPKKAQRQMGMTFPGDRLPTIAEWEEAVARLKIAAIKLS
ncbi:hypothetical protein ACWDUN_11220 [Mycobacterium sp. NPDC003323]